MARLILSRVALALITLLVVSLILFWCVEWLPGDAATRILGRDATPQSLAVLRQKLQLNLPAATRYLHWLTAALHGDFGRSLVADRSVQVDRKSVV